MSDPDAVAVVGGGIVGSAVAYHLAREGVETTLFDRRDEGRATDAGAGIVAPATSSRTDSEAWFAFAVEAAAYYPRLVDALEAAGATDHGYASCDLLSVALDAAEVEQFERASRRTERRAEEYGTPEPDTFEEIPVDRARDLFPPLGDAERAMVYRDQARVDGRTFAAALRTAGESHGLAVERADVTDVRVDDGTVGRSAGGTGAAVTGVVAGGDTRDVDAVVVAGGAWSAAFGDALDLDVRVAPQRGQIVHLDVAARGGHGSAAEVDADTADWPIVTSFGHAYLVPWPGGRVAVGATREDGVGFTPRATVAGLHDLSGEALRIADGLRDAEPAETRVGLRPVTRDGLPLLGPAPDVGGAYLATGHGPTGLTLGPYSGKVVADLVRGVDPGADLAAFDPARFRSG